MVLVIIGVVIFFWYGWVEQFGFIGFGLDFVIDYVLFFLVFSIGNIFFGYESVYCIFEYVYIFVFEKGWFWYVEWVLKYLKIFFLWFGWV